MKKGFALLLAVCLSVGLMAGCSGTKTETTEPVESSAGSEQVTSAPASEGQGEATRTFTDSAGREITLTGTADVIAALRGSSYEKCLFYGAADRVVMAAGKTAWAQKVFPEFDPIVAEDPQNPNVEELVNKGVNLVLFWNLDDVIKTIEAVDIPVVVGSDESYIKVKSVEDFENWMKNDMTVYAQAIGGEEALAKAEKWCNYSNDIYTFITDRTSKLAETEIPSVYYVRGPEVTSTHAGKSITRWYVEIAGGKLVTSDIEEKISTVSAEQINEWNPDFIFMGRLKTTEGITDSADYAQVKAVVDGNVFVNPCGVYEWDYGSEGPLFALWLAKTLHPDLFEDVNMVQEVIDYYQEFYNYTLTADDAQLILNNMDPA